MAKFSLTKEILRLIRTLYSDEGFHERAIKRIGNEINAALMIEMQRTNNIGKEIKSVNLEKGEIEIGDIIKPPEESKLVTAKK